MAGARLVRDRSTVCGVYVAHIDGGGRTDGGSRAVATTLNYLLHIRMYVMCIQTFACKFDMNISHIYCTEKAHSR